MDRRTVEKLSDKVNLTAREQRPKHVIRKKARKARPIEFVQVYQEWIQREKQLLCLNKYARELAQKASKARSHAPSPHALHPSPPPPDQSILQIRRHLRTLTSIPVTHKIRKRKAELKKEPELLALERREIDTEELWKNRLPELTAVRYGHYKPRPLRGQIKGNYSPVAFAGLMAEADTQTPEPGFQGGTTIRAVQVSRLSNSRGWGDQGFDLERRTC
jgi:hypothetical protein